MNVPIQPHDPGREPDPPWEPKEIPGQVPNPGHDPVPDRPIDPEPDKPIDPMPDQPVDPVPDQPIDPTPDRPTDPVRLPGEDQEWVPNDPGRGF